MPTLYSKQIQAIGVYLKHINAAEEELDKLGLMGDEMSATLSEIPVITNDGVEQVLGVLTDEIGGEWAFAPQKEAER